MKARKKLDDKAFMDFCEKRSKKEAKKFQKFIDAVPKQNRYLNPICGDFVKSCQKFLNDRSFLTEKQIEALENFANQDYEDGYDYDCEDDFEPYLGTPIGFIPNFDTPIY